MNCQALKRLHLSQMNYSIFRPVNEPNITAAKKGEFKEDVGEYAMTVDGLANTAKESIN